MFEEFKKLLEKHFYLPQVDSLSLLPVDPALKDMVWFDDTKLRKLFDYYHPREDKKPSVDALVGPLVFRDLDTEVALLAVERVHQVFGNYLQKSFDLAMEELRVFSEHSEQQPERQASKTKVAISRFPSDPDLRWEEVSIAFISNEAIKVRARGQLREYRFNQIGFENQISGKPNRLWLLLQAFGLRGGQLSWQDLSSTGMTANQVQSNVKRLRKILRNFMGIENDPFHPYRKVKAYEAKFTLTGDAAAFIDSDEDAPESDWETVYSQAVDRLR